MRVICNYSFLVGVCFFATSSLAADTSLFGGTYNSWPTSWTAVNSMNDGIDSGIAAKLDFVGDSSNPGGYCASDAQYVFFRFQVHTNAVTTSAYRDALFLLIDVAGIGTANLPDFAISWDSKSNDPTKHGLEMQVLNTQSNIWNGINMADMDATPSTKTSADINGPTSGPRTGDGYVRSVDGQSTVNFGTTSFIDYAVSWHYLYTQTGLRSNQTWQLALASVANATDHNNLGQNGDIGGGANPTTSVTIGWSAQITPDGKPVVAVPEPSTWALVSLALVPLFFRRNRS